MAFAGRAHHFLLRSPNLPMLRMRHNRGTGRYSTIASFISLYWVLEIPCERLLHLIRCSLHLIVSDLISHSIMPPGLPHAVFSVAKEGFQPTSVLMTGSHFLSEFSMSSSLEAAISHSLWHDVWTNATHDDVIFHVDWMLHDILLRSQNGVPSNFNKGNVAFALLTYARFAPWLRSLPHQLHNDNPTWLHKFDPIQELHLRLSENPSTAAATLRMMNALNALGRKADELIAALSPQDRQAFNTFWEATWKHLQFEISRRVQYNSSSLQD